MYGGMLCTFTLSVNRMFLMHISDMCRESYVLLTKKTRIFLGVRSEKTFRTTACMTSEGPFFCAGIIHFGKKFCQLHTMLARMYVECPRKIPITLRAVNVLQKFINTFLSSTVGSS